MITLRLVFLVLAVVCFLLAACNISSPRINLQALGLLFWVLGTIAG